MWTLNGIYSYFKLQYNKLLDLKNIFFFNNKLFISHLALILVLKILIIELNYIYVIKEIGKKALNKKY